MASTKPAAASLLPAVPTPSPAPAINPMLLALACSGNYRKLHFLLNMEDAPSSFCNDPLLAAYASGAVLTPDSLLKGVTAEGDTALHAVAASGNDDNFLRCADIIFVKAEHLLFMQNKRGDTPLHLAARARKSGMVDRLIALAKGIIGGTGPAISNGAIRVKALLETENKLKETVLHEAIRIRNDDMVMLLMDEDSELATLPKDGASPLYLAIILEDHDIAKTLHEKSGGSLSYSGPNGQNALHAAVLRGSGIIYAAVRRRSDLVTMLLGWNKELTIEEDENGSTPLHFAASLLRPGSVCRQVLEANPLVLYHPDHDGLFPIHTAASVGAKMTVSMFVNKFPSTAGLRDAKGRTFLHVAVVKEKAPIVFFARRNQSLSWILNMQDKDGNTALHLAVQEGSLPMVCSLLTSLQVELNLTNEKGHTPLDISRYKVPPGLIYDQNSIAFIRLALRLVKARSGASRQDHFHENYKYVHGVKSVYESKESQAIKDATQNLSIGSVLIATDENYKYVHGEKSVYEIKESQAIKDATQNLSIGSVLIATVTFGANFALPGGYRADDHTNGGSPTLAGRYAFDAFMIANTISFICSSIATMGFMHSGTSLVGLRSRKVYFGISAYLMRTSISSLTAAFALAAYIVLAPVAHKTAIVICVLTSLVILSSEIEIWGKCYVLAQPLRIRKGLMWTIIKFSTSTMTAIALRFWPIIFSFGFAMHPMKHHVPTMPPPVQPPTPLA